jgi:hypothetical protein
MAAVERICQDNELVISTWAAIHLKQSLAALYWSASTTDVPIQKYWEDSTKYLYLRRLRDQNTLFKVLQSGSTSRDFFGLALGKSGDDYQGFCFGTGLTATDANLLVIEPNTAVQHENLRAEQEKQARQQRERELVESPKEEEGSLIDGGNKLPGDTKILELVKEDPLKVQQVAKSFHGTVDISTLTFKARLQEVSDEILNLLARDPNGKLKITLEIQAEFPNGVEPQVQRAVLENAATMNFKVREWE